MKFVKLFDQTCGKHQIMCRLTQVDDGRMGLAFSTYIDSLGIIEVVHAFSGRDVTLEAFGFVTEAVATKVIKDALAELKEQAETGEVTH